MSRIRIQESERVPVKFQAGDRDLLDALSYVDLDYLARLEPIAASRQLIGHFSLDELEDLLGCIASEANHTEDSRLEKRLDSLGGRLRRTMERYDDGLWQGGML